ncbi:nascent polypeptide-associated complex subunit alpha, muscle-specific form-like [Anguilla anguilla]|uniref:nascent polypeptide-associated complex subunit alpha, muscle-specific form-like n=1 Tax=Anguilla anguilla TaxID=7936 RepID=UPI0015AB6474|nr:nascent polypeptide-associated complex subunit alpha, muscle-specific form-like [Anguilla anguilla]
MAKWMTLSEVLQIWRREFERESYGDSQAQSMGVAIDMVEDNSSQGSPGPSAVSPSTQPPPAAASANQDSPGSSAVCPPSTQSPPAAASANQDSPGSSAVCPPSTQSPPAAASANQDSPGSSAICPPSTQSPPAVVASARPESPGSLYSPGPSVVSPPSRLSPPAVAASANLDSPASLYSPGLSVVSPTSTQSPPAVAVSANQDIPASLYSPGPSVFCPPSTKSPHPVAAHLQSSLSKWDYSQSPHGKRRVIDPESKEGWHDIIDEDEEPGQFPGRYAVCTLSKQSLAAAAAASASPDSHCPSAVSPPPTQSLTAANTSAAATDAHLASSLGKWDNTKLPHAKRRKIDTESEEGWHDINDEDEEPGKFPGHSVVFSPSIRSVVAAEAASPGSPDSPYSPGSSAVPPPLTQSPPADAASPESPASPYSPGSSAVSPTTQSPPAVAASANPDSPASLYSPGPCVVSPPSTQPPPAVAASANTDSPASLYSPGPSVVSPPSTQSPLAVAASANSDSPASLYSPGPCAVFPPSTQSPPPVAASSAAAHLQSSLGKWDDSQSPHAKRRVMDPDSEEGWHDINNEDEEPGQLPGNCAVCSPSTQSLATSAAASASPDSHGPSAVSPPSTQFLTAAASAHPDIPGSSDFVPPSTQYLFSASAFPDVSGPAGVSPPSTESVAASASADSPGPAAVSLPSTQSPPVVASASPESPGPSALSLPSTQSPLAAAAPAAVPPRRTPVKRTMGHDFQSPRSKRRVIDPDYEEGWHGINDEDEEPRQFPFHPKRTPGVQLDCQHNYTPLELFQLFFSKDTVKILCQNTNKNMERKRLQGFRTAHIFKEVTPGDMSNYISMVIYLGLVRPSSFRDLWRTDKLHSHYFPSSVMPGYKFMAIGSYLHMSDPAEDVLNDQLRGQEGYDPLFRLKPLQNQILTACRAYYHPYQNLSIDERMVATKGRIGIKQFMKDKPTKWGFKLFVLADSKSGYTCDFSVYQGKAFTPSGNGLSYDAVVNLLRVPFLGTGYHLFVDNFYTSTALFRHLHQIRYGACGTMRENLTCFPKTTVNALPKRADRGDLRWIRDGPLLYVKWKDNRDVCLCSTIHKAYSGQSVQRRVRDPNEPRSTRAVPVPDPVVQYNKYMGGVDLSDALIKYYNVNQKTMRWYKKLFLHFVDIAVVNSYIIHKELVLIKGQRPMTQKRFRETLCMQLAKVGKHGSTRQEKVEEVMKMAAPKPQETVEEKKPPEAPVQKTPPFSCFPVTVTDVSGTDSRFKSTRGRRSCVLCSSRKIVNKTIYKCNSCDVPLCIVVDRICFTEWHNLKNSQAPSKM